MIDIAGIRALSEQIEMPEESGSCRGEPGKARGAGKGMPQAIASHTKPYTSLGTIASGVSVSQPNGANTRGTREKNSPPEVSNRLRPRTEIELRHTT